MTRVIRVDPYDKTTCLMLPFIAQRILEMAHETGGEANPEQVMKKTMIALLNRAADVLVLALVNDKGQIVGHVVATVNSDEVNRWVWVLQCKADDNVQDAREVVFAMLDDLGRQFGAKKMLMATGRNEKAWERKYGFRTSRRVMERDIPQASEDEESE